MSDWTNYSERKPPAVGVYEWRMPSKGTPGIVIIFAAHMRERGAGFERVVSPSFDYWDGYRLHVPKAVQWRETHGHADLPWHSDRMVAVDGLDIAPCPYCQKVPSFKTAGPGYYFGAKPHEVSLWQFRCCAWAATPWMQDPREIEKRRREAFAECVRSQEAPNG